MRYICTYFDKNYLSRGEALVDSLRKNSDEFVCYILALDQYTFDYFSDLNRNDVIPIPLEDYKKYFNIDVNKYKDKKEFYFSITPGFCLYLLRENKNIDLLVYLDADVYLYNKLEYLYNEIGDASIAICPHRLPWFMRLFATNHGIFNVGVNAFRRDKIGMQCLEEWHYDCTNWYPGIPDYALSYFSDQIWLDSWPSRYNNLKIIGHIGIDVAPWNAINYKFTKKNGEYYVNDSLLIIYHFASIKKIEDNVWTGNGGFLLININQSLLDLYKNYIVCIDKNNDHDILTLSVSGSKLKRVLYFLTRPLFNDKIYLNHKYKKN